MREVLFALGLGIIKVLASLLIGAGVGLVTFGLCAALRPEIWALRQPPGELFLAIGAAMFTSGGMMLALFLLPRRRRLAQDDGREYRLPADELGISARPLRRDDLGAR